MAAYDDKNDLTTGVVWKKLLRFFIPILLGLLFQQLYNTVDAVIIGRFVGDLALAAVGGSSAIITQTVIGFFSGLNMGAAVVIAQRFGANDRDGLHRTLHTALTFCLLAGAAVMVLGFIFAPNMLELLNNPADIMEDSVTYLRIYFLGSVPLLVYNLCQGTMQGVGDSRRPLIYLAVSCCTNIALDLIFVVILGLAVKGVAWASVISMTLCAVLALTHLIRTDKPYKLSFKELRLEKPILLTTLKIGFPSGIESCVYSVSNLIIQASLNGFGSLVVSAWTATGKLEKKFAFGWKS